MKKKCQDGGPALNPYSPYVQKIQLPGFQGIDHQALMNAHPITGVPPGMQDVGQQPATMENKWQFGLNYGHIAASNFVQAGMAGLRRQNQERDFQRYNQAQSNPLLQIPFNPNTSNTSLYGQQVMQKGGYTENVKNIFNKYPGLNSFASPDDFEVSDATGQMKDVLNKNNFKLEYFNKGDDKYIVGKDTIPLSNSDKYRVFVNPDRVPQAQREQAIALDMISHGFHNNKDYQSFSSDLGNRLRAKYGDKVVDANGGTDAYIRGYLSDMDEYQPYKKELDFLPQGYFDGLNNILQKGKMRRGGRFQEGGDVFGIGEEIEQDIMNPTYVPQVEQEAPQEAFRGPIEEDYSDVLQVSSGARTAYMADMDEPEAPVDENGDSIETTAFPSGNGNIDDFKRRIAGSEGAGYFMPTQIKGKDGKPASSAFGKYQFIKGTREGVRKQFFPDMKHSEFENLYKTSPAFQEQVMDAYSGHLLNKYGGDQKKAATAFFLGEGAADKVNDLNYRPTTGNSTVGEYLNRGKFQQGGAYQDSLTLYNVSKKAANDFEKMSSNLGISGTSWEQIVKSETNPSVSKAFKNLTNLNGVAPSPQYTTPKKKVYYNGEVSPISAQVNVYKKPTGSTTQATSRKPITVNDPNDPRLKSYKDSLNLYNQSERIIKQVSAKEPIIKDYETPVLSVRSDNPGSSLWPMPDENGEMPKIRPIGHISSKNDHPSIGLSPIFKKPVQPYIYKPVRGIPTPSPVSKVSTASTPFDQHLEASENGQYNWDLAKKRGRIDGDTVFVPNAQVDRLPYAPINTSANPYATRYTTETTGNHKKNNRAFPLYNKPKVVDYLDVDVTGQTMAEQTGPYGITWPTFNQADGHGQHTANFPDAASWNNAKQMLGTPQSSTEQAGSGTALYPSRPAYQKGGPIPSYSFSPYLTNPSKGDSTQYKKYFDAIVANDPRHIAQYENMQKMGAPSVNDKESYIMYENTMNAYQDALMQQNILRKPTALPAKPTYKEGGSYYLSDKQIEELKRQGYELE